MKVSADSLRIEGVERGPTAALKETSSYNEKLPISYGFFAVARRHIPVTDRQPGHLAMDFVRICDTL
jgi:hypothetical protein